MTRTRLSAGWLLGLAPAWLLLVQPLAGQAVMAPSHTDIPGAHAALSPTQPDLATRRARPEPGAPPRVALVLSGGAAKGLAHVGVLRVLEAEGIVPEIVTGASMGALLGGLYAVGYPAAWLDSLVTSLEWGPYLRDAPEHEYLALEQRLGGERVLLDLPLEHGRVALPSGAIPGQRISDLLARLTWSVQAVRDFRRLPRAFVATGTDIETGETVVLDAGSLARALRASMSIPGVFSPVRYGERLLVDGGVTRNLPARDARALGAEIVICSDVTDRLHPASRLRSLLDVLSQTVTIYISASAAEDRPLCDVYIRPETTDLMAADFNRAPEFVRLGEQAANAVRPELAAIAARVRAAGGPAPVPPAPRPEPVRISELRIEGAVDAAQRAVRRALQLEAPGEVTPALLDEAIKRAFATELFDEVHYRLEALGRDTVLVVTVDTRESDRLGLGLRYDDTWKAALLFTARLRNRLGFGSSSEFELRLGEQLRLGARHSHVGFAGSPLIAGGATSYSRTPWPFYVNDQPTSEARVEVANAELLFGTAAGRQTAIVIAVKGEHARVESSIGMQDTSRTWTYASAALTVRHNSFDRAAFPTRGRELWLRSEYALSNPRFHQHVAHLGAALPVGRQLTAVARATAGTASPAEALPPHYRFMLGGSYPSPLFAESQVSFVGLRPQQRPGAAVVRVGAGLQWEVRRNIFITGRADVGYAGRKLTMDADVYDVGYGLAFGALTPLGPMELTASRTPQGNGRLEASIGRPF